MTKAFSRQNIPKFEIYTFCHGSKYKPILSHWEKRTRYLHPNTKVRTLENYIFRRLSGYAWWDIVRLEKLIKIMAKKRIPIVYCDLDLILERNISPLVELNYDFIVSKEIGGGSAFPKEVSSDLGFGLCTGFYITKYSSIEFLRRILLLMRKQHYGSNSDQVTIMHYIHENEKGIEFRNEYICNKEYTNIVIRIDGINICILDSDIITRDPITDNDQFGNHINIDNVGGSNNFIKYFYSPLDKLPLTCRCGRFGNADECLHLSQRETAVSEEIE